MLGEITPCYTVTFRRTSKHSASRMWRAITDPGELAQWVGCPAKVDLVRGGDYVYEFGEGKQLDGVIVRVEPERRLTFTVLDWERSVCEWELEADGDGCRYTFTHQGCRPERFADGGFAAGWHVWVEMLDAYLDGRTVVDDRDRWSELSAQYVRAFEALR